jgi:hypothetical protein
MSDPKTDRILSSQGDVVLQGVWQAKDTLSAAYEHDIDRLFEETRARQRDSGHNIVNLTRSRRKTGKP